MSQRRKTDVWELYGIFRWCRPFYVNRRLDGPPGTNWEAHDGMYVTDFIMDEENYEKFQETGSGWKAKGMTKGERDKYNLEKGQFLIQPRRKHKHSVADFGGPPLIVLADGTPIDPEDGFGVGNDSEGYLNFTTYETDIQTGSRWNGAQIMKWEKFPLPKSSKPSFQNRGETVIHEVELDDDGGATESKANTKTDDLEDDSIPL